MRKGLAATLLAWQFLLLPHEGPPTVVGPFRTEQGRRGAEDRRMDFAAGLGGDRAPELAGAVGRRARNLPTPAAMPLLGAAIELDTRLDTIPPPTSRGAF
jgi:hypothetical protein